MSHSISKVLIWWNLKTPTHDTQFWDRKAVLFSYSPFYYKNVQSINIVRSENKRNSTLLEKADIQDERGSISLCSITNWHILCVFPDDFICKLMELEQMTIGFLNSVILYKFQWDPFFKNWKENSSLQTKVNKQIIAKIKKIYILTNNVTKVIDAQAKLILKIYYRHFIDFSDPRTI